MDQPLQFETLNISMIYMLTDIMRLLEDAPRITWTKPDGRKSTYICIHEGLHTDWLQRYSKEVINGPTR